MSLAHHILEAIAAPAPTPTPKPEVKITGEGIKDFLLFAVAGILVMIAGLRILNRGSQGDMSGATNRTAGTGLGVAVLLTGLALPFIGPGLSDFIVGTLFR